MPQYRSYSDEKELDDLNVDVRERRWRDDRPGFIDRIPPRARFWSGIGAVAWIWYGQRQGYTWGKIGLWLGIGAALLYFMFQNSGLKRELTDRECRISLAQQLRWLQQTPMNGVLTVEPGVKLAISQVGQKLYQDGNPWKREYRVEFHQHDGTVDTYSAGIDIYNGDLINLIERRAGYDGSESPNIKTIMSSDLKRTAAAEGFIRRGGQGGRY